MALRQSERIVAKNMSIVKRNVAAAQAFFDEHEDLFEWHAPAAGTTAFPRCALYTSCQSTGVIASHTCNVPGGLLHVHIFPW